MRLRGFMEVPDSGGVPAVSRGEFDSLARRVSTLEHSVRLLSSQPFTDQARTPYSWGDSAGEPYYHHGDIAGSLRDFVPWISTTTRFSERLTSIEFLKVTLGQALVIGASFGAMGGLIAWGFDYPIALPVVCGVSGFILSVGVLVLVNRLEIHALVKGQADKDKKRRTEMRIQIDKPGTHDGIEFLYLNSNITEDQLRKFAERALDGSSLAVHKWVGQGSLFTRGQYDDLMTELEQMNYVTKARGPVARSLTAKGRALMRGLSE